jgi:hypothetical protein
MYHDWESSRPFVSFDIIQNNMRTHINKIEDNKLSIYFLYENQITQSPIFRIRQVLSERNRTLLFNVN